MSHFTLHARATQADLSLSPTGARTRARVLALALVLAMSATLAAVPVGSAPAAAATTRPSGACTNPGSGLHVAPWGSDSNSGTASAPYRTISHAVATAPNEGRVIIHGGDYRESVTVFHKRLDLVAAPGETVWITGSDVVHGWTATSHGWRSNAAVAAGLDQRSRFASAGMTGTNPLAGHLAMTFIDGYELTQVATTSAVAPNTFHVDGSGHVTIGRDPNGRVVEVSARSTGLVLDDASGSTVTGIGVRRHASRYDDRAAVRVDEGSHHVTISRSLIVDNANAGLQVLGTDATITHNEFRGNGRLGMNGHHADRLLVAHNRFDRNNDDGFDTGAAAGGIKVTASRDITIRDNASFENNGDAIWIDVSSLGIDVLANHSEDNTGYGIHIEVSAQALVASNSSVRDDRGIQIGESNDVDIWNNVVIDAAPGIAVLDGTRDSAKGQGNSFGLPHDDRYPFPIPEITWNVHDIDIRNNVIARGTLDDSMLFVHDPKEQVSAFDMNVDADHNLLHRTTTSHPRWVVGWGDWPDRMMAIETVAEWRAAMAERGSTNGIGDIETTGSVLTAVSDETSRALSVRSGGPGHGTGTSLPTWIANRLGTSTNDIGLARGAGFDAGIDCAGAGAPSPPAAVTSIPPGTHPFVDVSPGSYYEDAVVWLVATGATTGTTPTTFSPHQTATRGQLATIIWRLAGKPGAPYHPFDDVSAGTYYNHAVAWLAATGATTGTTPTTFSPHQTATRGQLATIIWRLAGKPGASGRAFDDVSPNAYYAEAVAWLAATGATTGTTPTTFSPDRTATRAELATIIWRLAQSGHWRP